MEGFQCPAKKYQCKACHKFGHFTSMCYQKKHAYSKPRRPKVHKLQAGTIYMHAAIHHMTTWMMTALPMTHSACKWWLNTIKRKNKGSQGQHIWLPTWPIDYNPDHCRNLYLRARLDTCANVNLMPASVYQLVFNDPNMNKLVPSKLQVGTYMTDTMKIVGPCTFHLVHPDNKRLLETNFYMVMNDGSCVAVMQNNLTARLNPTQGQD